MRVSLSAVAEFTVTRVSVCAVAGLVFRFRSVRVSVTVLPAATVALAVFVLTAAVWALAIEATFEMTVPPATASPMVASKVSVVVAPAPFRGPTFQTRFGLPAALAPVPVIEPATYVLLAGTVSFTTMPVAFMLPLLRTTIV